MLEDTCPIVLIIFTSWNDLIFDKVTKGYHDKISIKQPWNLKFSTNGTSGLKLDGTISGSTTTVTGANTNIQTQQFGRREFAHVAASFNSVSQKVFLFYNKENKTLFVWICCFK